MVLEAVILTHHANSNTDSQVWADNLDEELDALRATIEKYPVVSMVRGTFASAVLKALSTHLTSTTFVGHGIPWHRRSSDRDLPHWFGLSLSNHAVQRRLAQDHSAWVDACGRGGEHAGSVLLAVQLQVQSEVGNRGSVVGSHDVRSLNCLSFMCPATTCTPRIRLNCCKSRGSISSD